MTSLKKPMGNERFELAYYDFNDDYAHNRLSQLPKTHYPLPLKQRDIITNIFSVPVPNSIGTHQMNDKVATIHFDHNIVNIDTIAILPAGGHYAFPDHPISYSTTGFTQTRGFNLIDFKKNHIKEFCTSMCRSLSEEIKAVWTINSEKHVMLFWSYEYGGYAQNHLLNQRHTLRTYDFSGEEERLIAEMILDPSDERGFIDFVSFQNDTIFVYRHDQIKAYNTCLQPKSHPLFDLFEEHKEKHGYFDINTITVHPRLPFALIDEYDLGPRQSAEANWIACWGDDKQKGFHLLLPGNPTDIPRLSPSGDWLILSSPIDGKLQYIAFPVTDNPPIYLGRPVLLGPNHQSPFETNQVDTFTSNPESFVVLTPDGIDRYLLP